MRSREAGFTFVEVVIASGVLVVVAGLVTATFGSSLGLWQQSNSQSEASRLANRACNRIADELTLAGASTVVETLAAPSGGRQITFKVGSGFKDGETNWGALTVISWEPDPADPEDGVDNNGNGIVDEGMVVLKRNAGDAGEQVTVLVRSVSSFLEGEVDNGIDDNGNGLVDERGLSFHMSGGALDIRLTLVRKDDRGRITRRTAGTSVVLRN